jgi:hypothetical protein
LAAFLTAFLGTFLAAFFAALLAAILRTSPSRICSSYLTLASGTRSAPAAPRG